MNIFELTIPRTEHQKKTPTNLPPSLLSRRPSIHRFNIAIENESKTHPPRKTKINDLQESCDETKFIPFYSTTNEKRMIDPLSSISRRRRKFENSKIRKQKIDKKKDFSCEFDLFICCTYIHTYIHTWYLLLYIYEVILSIISFSLKKNLRVLFFGFCPLRKSRRGEEKKGKGKKKEGEEEKGNPFHIVPTYPGTLGFSFSFFFFSQKDVLIHRYI